MNKKILAKTLLPISTIVLLGGGIASTLVLSSCGNGGNKVVTFTTAAETLEYLEKNSTNCPSKEVDTWDDSGYEHIIDISKYTSYVNKYITQKVLLNALIYTVAFHYDLYFTNHFSSLDFSTNYVHASYWNDDIDDYLDFYANLNKFNSFEDFSIVYSGSDFGAICFNSKNNLANNNDICHTDEGDYPLFWWEDEGCLALSPFDFNNITYIVVPHPDSVL